MSSNDASLRANASLADSSKIWNYGGTKIAYFDNERTDLPVLLCLHAIGHGSGDFQYVILELGDKWRIVALDWPGQGCSGFSLEKPGVVNYKRLVEAFIEDKQFRKLNVIGNSIGGGVALLLAARRPEMIGKVIISNPAGTDKGGLFARAFTWWMATRFDNARSNPTQFLTWFKSYYEKVLPSPFATKQRQNIIASGLETAAIIGAAWRSFSEEENDIRAELSNITAPVLIAWAKKDEFVQWDRNKQALSAIPNKKIIQFDVGHTPFLEAPEEFLLAFDKFTMSD